MVTKDKNVETWMTVGAPENPTAGAPETGQNPPEMPELNGKLRQFWGLPARWFSRGVYQLWG